MPRNRVVQRPIVLGLVGDSAVGKSTLASGIAAILGPERVTVLRTDDYHRLSRDERRARQISALSPDANYVDILEQHLALLRDGKPVLKPVYDHARGVLAPPQYLEAREFVIVEGLLGYHTRALRDCYDVKVFLEPDERLRLKWKVARDCAERGYTPEEVMRSLALRQYDSATYIQPQRTFADMVVRFHPPEDHPEESGARLNARHLLRPTLPHPDLSPVLETGAKSGFRLALARDTDGKPVDVLEIAGDIDARRAKAVEDLLWSLIPEAHHLRTALGQFIDDKGEPAQSHPLALSQLLVTYHLVKAALGHYAR
ncbi:phosphoribulokinase [Magnetospirillum sp. UT-4]|uniref:phosphoribulokinase n=1 Tax=Magnetospirillum sp. UT-4 TaxID=2681467 RepID=UPI001380803D|nr:phosphoribulokinase [Magnetospirillum sp. UT-4]CAA7614736.1 putative Phosphoribulokinase [Magnetospirillum sp. UT-4]